MHVVYPIISIYEFCIFMEFFYVKKIEKRGEKDWFKLIRPWYIIASHLSGVITLSLFVKKYV